MQGGKIRYSAPPAASPVAPYGMPITPEQARVVANRIEAEKVRRGIDTAAIAVVDPRDASYISSDTTMRRLPTRTWQ